MFRFTEGSTRAFLTDVITDFATGVDRIDLSLIDANAESPGEQTFVFVGSAAFTAVGQARFANGVLSLNIDFDLSAETDIRFSLATTTLAGSDLIL